MPTQQSGRSGRLKLIDVPDDEMRRTLASGEGRFVEFKRECARDVVKEVAAFASSGGGSVLVGVEDDGSVCGLRESGAVVRQRIQSWISERVYPTPRFGCSVRTLDGHELVIIDVDQGTEPVYSADNCPRIRVGEASQRMPANEVQRRYQLSDLQRQIDDNHPNIHVALGIMGQSELATMSYDELLVRLSQDLIISPQQVRPPLSGPNQ